METPTEERRRQVIAAREELGDGLDDLTLAFRSAIDIPAKIRKNPLQAAALAGGAGFLAVGEPKKVIRAAMHRIRPSTRRPHEGLLPKDIDKVVRRKAGPRAEEIETALENDFADYLKRKGKITETEPNAQKSLWKTYDTIVGPLGALVAKQLVDRLAAADANRPRAGGPKPNPETGKGVVESKTSSTPNPEGVRGGPGKGAVTGNR
jgi:hypothetical protein